MKLVLIVQGFLGEAVDSADSVSAVGFNTKYCWPQCEALVEEVWHAIPNLNNSMHMLPLSIAALLFR
jgi:hypothetical protein